MNQNLNEIILFLVLVVGAIAYLFGTFRKGVDGANSESNKILRTLIEDQRSEITALKTDLATIREEITELRQRRDFLEGLVMTALAQHFKSNPRLATQVKKNMKIDK